jgi:ParB-like nuclease domain
MATKTKPKPVPDEQLVTLPIDDIVPYWRNPRVATEAAIAKLMRSIETYGYQNPIMVDSDKVIITGHTRYLALRRLGWTEIPVIVTNMPGHLAKEYRIIDNRSAEFTYWDRTRLLAELRQFTDGGMLNLFFPEIDLSLTDQHTLDTASLVTPPEPPPVRHPPNAASRVVTCPHCYHQFEYVKPSAQEVNGE